MTAAALLAAGGFVGSTVSSYESTASTPANAFTAAPDWTAPVAAAAVVAKAAGGDPGFIRPTGTYYVYASVTDTGGPAAGIASVTANVSILTTAPNTPAAVTGAWTVGGVAYNRRTAVQTVKSPLPNGVKNFDVVSTDAASPANAGTQTFTVTADGTVPAAISIQTANATGGIVGRPELGDTITFTASEPLDPAAILTGWDGTTTNVTAAIYSDGAPKQDYVFVGPLGATSPISALPFGVVDLGRKDYTAADATVYFGQTGTRSTLTRTGDAIMLTLGTPSDTATTTAKAGTLQWTPSAVATDRAGNAMSTSAVSVSVKAF
jgi:hypothetical protein